MVGFATRQSVILEFAPTFISIIMAGKVGSFITSSIGTMRVTEQIDALEVMGINAIKLFSVSKNSCLNAIPFYYCYWYVFRLIGGMAACVFGGYTSLEDYIIRSSN